MTREQIFNTLDTQYRAALAMAHAGVFTDEKCSGYYAGLLEAYDLAINLVCEYRNGKEED